jgi:hypothetical protein
LRLIDVNLRLLNLNSETMENYNKGDSKKWKPVIDELNRLLEVLRNPSDSPLDISPEDDVEIRLHHPKRKSNPPPEQISPKVIHAQLKDGIVPEE